MFDKYVLNYVVGESYNKLLSIKSELMTIDVKDMTESTIDVLTALTYASNKERTQYATFVSIGKLLGFDVLVEGIKDLNDKGIKIIPDQYYRRLVIEKNKIKYKGLMRK